MIERYGHGGDLRSAAEIYGIHEKDLLDYSSNMNPLGPPQCVEQVLLNYINDITAYPDPAVRELRQAIASKHNIHMDQVIAGNGAAELIDLIIRYFKPTTAAIMTPSFIEYEQALVKAGCTIRYIEAEPEHQFAISEAHVTKVVNDAEISLYLLGHPNNPTGQLLSNEVISSLLATGAIVVLDEAFIDFHQDEQSLSWIHAIDQYSNLFVIRSMTKFYSIPGIRLGYAVGQHERIHAMKELQYPWSVNSLAQQIGVAVLKDEGFTAKTKMWLHKEINWMHQEITAIGLIPYKTVTNYMLIRIPKSCRITSEQLQLAMGRKGILIRNANTFRGLDSSYIRLAIKTRAQNSICIEALREVLTTCKGD